MKEINNVPFSVIEAEYLTGLFCESAAQEMLYSLSGDERRLLILMAENNSIPKVAKILGVSHTSVSRRIKKLREKIISQKLITKEYTTDDSFF